MINKEVHELTGLYCPHCYRQLKRVIGTGFTFCPADITCDYEAMTAPKKPITELEALRGRNKRLMREIARVKNSLDALNLQVKSNDARIARLLDG